MKKITRSLLQQKAFLSRLQAIESAPLELIDHGGGSVQPGEIYLANESRFQENYFQEHLTTYAVGWRDPSDISATRRVFAPEVEVPPFFEYSEAINAEEFIGTDDDDVSAIGADYKRIEPDKRTKVVAKVPDRGIMLVVDLRSVRGQSGWEQKKVARLLRRVERNRLRRAVALINAAATNTGKTWGSSADPDMDVENEQKLALNINGVGFNRVVYGHSAWILRKQAYRAQDNAGGYASAAMNESDLAGSFMVDRVMVSRERYQSTDAAKTEIVGSTVHMFHAVDGADVDDASNIKAFVAKYGEGEQGAGNFVRVFIAPISINLVGIVVSYQELVKITSTLAIRKFTVS
ncbi:hypothetical protein [Opitutus terrae]|uniref:Uncharacterized protein n=1 Tax=Opitutus terrae (strain DSM 11246 / JCM 15787 / PB90-1) TaxID=452637 RepID=B1ZV31_OPITP|nr:hypothetical protein [Opitutus terrae]ACB76698.1 hypothetical protein Oter_3421 [Opitutus terrae PB90-1]